MPGEVTNAVGFGQLALRPGDLVHYEDDLGNLTTQLVRSTPSMLGGHTLVIWLHGKAGAVALSRCRPISRRGEFEPNKSREELAEVLG